MFGYHHKTIPDNRTLLFAKPEKAILDLLYLYPFDDSVQELEELRLDESFMAEDLDQRAFKGIYCAF